MSKRRPKPPPDDRGPRPDDPNELAKWIVEQTTGDDDDRPDDDEPPPQDH